MGNQNGAGQKVFTGSSEMHERVNRYNWTLTSLGAIETWSQSLKSQVKTLLASRYPMILTWGENFTQIYNDAYSKLIGDKHPSALGEDIRITLAEGWDVLGPMIKTVMEGGVANWTPALPLVLERAGYREESYFSVSHAPAEDDDGRVAGMLAVCSEVTEQILSERRLRLLRDLSFRAGETSSIEMTCQTLTAAIAENPLDVPFALIYLRESEGKTLRLCSAVGINQGEASSPLTVNLETREADVWQLARAADGEVVLIENVQEYLQMNGGFLNDPLRNAFSMPIAGGGQTAALGVLIAGASPNRALDDSYKSFYELLAGQVSIALGNALAYEEERRRTATLVALDLAKTEFFSNVSHEFRTPLTLMLAPLEDVLNNQDRDLSKDDRAHLETVHRNSLRLLKLVNTLLDFSSIEAGRINAVYQATDLSKMTAELASAFRSTVEKAGVKFIVDCQPLAESVSKNVFVDREMWEKIVFNLLSNAFKFTFEGVIAVRLRQIENWLELAVSDTGTGIDPAELPHVFERFHRAANSRGRTFEGSGIGLSLVRELVRLHGGTVNVQSSFGSGTTFTVQIPVGAEHLPAYQIATERDLTATSVQTFLNEIPITSVNEVQTTETNQDSQDLPLVLLVDDNADMREYINRLLSQNYKIAMATDGQAALEFISKQLPDLVLTDVMMPRVNGFELLKKLREDNRTATIPVIMLSARAGEESKIEGLDQGADDYLIKPFSAKELLSRVQSNLSMVRFRRDAAKREAELLAQAQVREETLKREQNARAQVEEASRLKDEFLLTISHELRTPLNSILGWAQMLQTGKLPAEDQNRGLSAIARNAKAQAKIIEDLLDVSRIVTGKLRLETSAIEIAPIIYLSIDALRPAIEAKQIVLEVKLNSDAGMIYGDSNRLQQVFWNLLSNAVKFTPERGRIEVRLESDERMLQIVFEDNGKGMKSDFLPFVFERFRQADGATTRQYGGLGLGLAIVRHLVELHGGSVTAKSDGEGMGSTFTVCLPLSDNRKNDSIPTETTDILISEAIS